MDGEARWPAAKLTELVADALVLQQRRVVEGVPAVEDAGVPAQSGDAPQRQHRVVDEQRGRLLPQPGRERAVAAVLRVTQHQHFAAVVLLA